MDLESLGITVTSKRDAGTLVQYAFALDGQSISRMLAQILDNMPYGAELSFPDPSNGDCNLEVRRSLEYFETKLGCHGASGTWCKASPAQAHAWLLPGANAAAHLCRPGYGAVLVIYKNPRAHG